LKALEEYIRNGRMHTPINSTFIALIPKLDELQSFDDFKTISLCKFLYKIVAKIIARRLKPILSDSISQEKLVSLKAIRFMKQLVWPRKVSIV
jgi:hypothetical protein